MLNANKTVACNILYFIGALYVVHSLVRMIIICRNNKERKEFEVLKMFWNSQYRMITIRHSQGNF